jgi:hypothetical protein
VEATGQQAWTWRSIVATVDSVAEEDREDERPSVSSFGWTSSRATRMYMIHHASLEELLEYLGLGPIPDAPPANWQARRRD